MNCVDDYIKKRKWVLSILLPVIFALLALLVYLIMTLDKGIAEMILWLSIGIIPIMAFIGLGSLVASFIHKEYRAYTLCITLSLWTFVALFIYLVRYHGL